jgi:ketosteroid isomerase-like protein
MRYLVLLASLAVATVACQDTTGTGMDDAALPEAASRATLDLREERASLVAAGNEVSSAIAAKGVPGGLGGALTHNGLLLSPRVATIQGREAAMDFLSTAPNAPSALSWEVIIADVSSDASHGYTWSQGSTTLDLGTGAITIPSFFLTYWKRTDSGRWRIAAFVLNQGGPQPLPLPDGFGTPTTRRGRQFPPTDLKTLRKELRATDAAFSAASLADGTGPAFEHFAAPNGIAVGGGTFVLGPAAIGEAFASGPNDVVSWGPRFADAAESGDLGFTVGDASFALEGIPPFYTKYLSVWRKQKNGQWRFVADFGNSRPAPTP